MWNKSFMRFIFLHNSLFGFYYSSILENSKNQINIQVNNTMYMNCKLDFIQSYCNLMAFYIVFLKTPIPIGIFFLRFVCIVLLLLRSSFSSIRVCVWVSRFCLYYFCIHVMQILWYKVCDWIGETGFWWKVCGGFWRLPGITQPKSTFNAIAVRSNSRTLLITRS